MINPTKRIFFLLAITIILFQCILAKSVSAQSKYAPIVVTGHLSNKAKLLIDDTEIPYILREMDFPADSSLMRTSKLTIKGNSFKMIFQPLAKYNYLLVKNLPIGADYYLVQQGDTLDLNIQDRGDFTYKSSKSFALQLELNKLPHLGVNVTKDDSTAVQRLASRRDSLANICDQILSAYKAQIATDLWELVRLNYRSNLGITFMSQLESMATSPYNNKITKKDAKFLIEQQYVNTTVRSDTMLIKNSIYYAGYVLMLNKAYSALSAKASQFKRDRFDTAYTNIQKNYSGLLQQKVLTELFLTSMNQSKNAKSLLDSCYEQIKEPLYRQMLDVLRVSNTLGKKAFAYNLPDIEGKMHSLEDLKGKIILAEFWFYGCEACMELQETLKPWKEKYKNNPNIVFLSINTDKKKLSWQNGLKTGLYNGKEDLNLSTYGRGFSHPMLQFYHFQGFPQLLLIDKNGNILTSNPERLSREECLAVLDDLIKNSL